MHAGHASIGLAGGNACASPFTQHSGVNRLPLIPQKITQKAFRTALCREHIAVRFHVQPGFARALRDAGVEIVEVSLPHTKYALPAYYIIAPAEASGSLRASIMLNINISVTSSYGGRSMGSR